MKYKNIKKSTPVDTYHNNLFIAVADMYWDMVDVGISPTEAKSLTLRNVNLVLQETMRQFKTGDIE